MVLANIASLLDVSPRDLTAWFWLAYTDAYDWVVEPNVLAMGTYAVGGLMTTKPYVSGAGYICKMSDFCSRCAFDPRFYCPLNSLYWAYLQRHRALFAGNPRMNIPLAALKRRSSSSKTRDGLLFRKLRRLLAAGEVVTPKALA